MRLETRSCCITADKQNQLSALYIFQVCVLALQGKCLYRRKFNL